MIGFYLDMGNKRGRKIHYKLLEINKEKLDKLILKYIDLKSKEYRIESVAFNIQDVGMKLKINKLREQ